VHVESYGHQQSTKRRWSGRFVGQRFDPKLVGWIKKGRRRLYFLLDLWRTVSYTREKRPGRKRERIHASRHFLFQRHQLWECKRSLTSSAGRCAKICLFGLFIHKVRSKDPANTRRRRRRGCCWCTVGGVGGES
jgi:hypothetical protein